MTASVLKQAPNAEQVEKNVFIRTKNNANFRGNPFIKLPCPVLDCSKLTSKKISGLAVHLIFTVFHRLAVKRRFVN